MKAEDIRFVTRGLGRDAAREFAEVSSEDSSTVEVADIGQLAEGIARWRSPSNRGARLANAKPVAMRYS
jgi:hypothetical protein